MSEPALPTRFFYTGGALPPDAPSYIRRDADDRLFARLQQGEYCYVLVSRQMGKSSLMVHTFTRLIRQNITAVMVDLNSIGDDTTQEQWYYSLTEQVAGQLGLNEQTDAFWDRSESKTALQRWVGAIEQMLRLYPDRPLVIFIDEIDQVRSLAFRTDEFFASIRSFHNRRTTEPDFQRLTFCLIGVALPSDLIEDPRITPFNIAERIDLTDFNEEQVVALKVGLQREEIQEEALLQRVFYWTNGHPYLTQRLCRAIVEDASIQTAQDVDRLCGSLFFGADATAPDDNINLVGTRLLHSDPDVMGLLTLCLRIVQGKNVRLDKANRLIDVLMLSGAVRSVGGSLQMRNRIYAHVFDHTWIARNMPDAELRRQRQAYRRGAVRALSLASGIIAIMGFLLYRTFRADQDLRKALLSSQQDLYIANISLAQKAYGEDNIPRVQQLLEECRRQDLKAYCGFEWRYLWGLIHQDSRTLGGHVSQIASVAFCGDGNTLITVDLDATIHRWAVDTGRNTETFGQRYSDVTATAVSPDTGMVGIASLNKTVSLHSAVSGRLLSRLVGFKHSVCSIAFSPDGRLLAAGQFDGSVTLRQIAGGAVLRTISGRGAWCDALAFSPKGDRLFISDAHGEASIYDLAAGHLLVDLKRPATRVQVAAFSPNGRMLATGAADGKVSLWKLAPRPVVKELGGHSNRVTALTFSPDGRMLATGSTDTTAKVWDVPSENCLRTLRGHIDAIRCVAFSPDRRTLATGAEDRTAKLWDVSAVDRSNRRSLGGEHSSVLSLGMAPDGKAVAVSGQSGLVELWEMTTGRHLRTLDQKANVVAFGADSRTLITADGKGVVTLNDLQRQSEAVVHRAAQAIWALDLCPGAGEVVVGGRQGSVNCIDIRTGRQIRTLKTPTDDASVLAFAPNGKWLAVLDRAGKGILLDYAMSRTVVDLSRVGVKCLSVCFSSDSQAMAVGFSDGTVELWNTLGAKREWSASAHTGAVFALTFSPDGRNLVTGSDDRKVRIWNVSIGREVGTLEGHRDSVIGLRFTPDGSSLLSIDQSRLALLWPAPAQNTIPAAKP